MVPFAALGGCDIAPHHAGRNLEKSSPWAVGAHLDRSRPDLSLSCWKFSPSGRCSTFQRALSVSRDKAIHWKEPSRFSSARQGGSAKNHHSSGHGCQPSTTRSTPARSARQAIFDRRAAPIKAATSGPRPIPTSKIASPPGLSSSGKRAQMSR